MSVTFFVEGLTDTYQIPNSAYNPEEPEDPIYNPRYESVDLYPSLNIANWNASIFLALYGVRGEMVGCLVDIGQWDDYITTTEKFDTFTLSKDLQYIARYKEKIKELIYIAKSQNKRVVYA